MKIVLGALLVFVVTISFGTAFGHGAGIEAVSYTHLTLPTILLV